METNNNVVSINKIKWSIIFQVSSNLSLFTQSIEKLVSSIDPKRTEILFLGNQDNNIFLNTFSYFCEKNKVPYNYADDRNHALELAKGMYIVFLTDHTIVSKNFLVKLTFCMENSDKENRTVIVSPISNEIAGDLNLTPFNLDGVQAALARQPKEKTGWVYTMNLSMFCFMVKKEVIHPLQNQREMILQANYDGHLTVSARDTLVYHHPEVIDESLSENFTGVTDPKLGILYRVKIDDEYIRDVFVKSLEKSAQLSSNIYVIDDNSKVKLGIFLREKHPDLWVTITKYEKFSRPYDEKRDFNELMGWAEKDGCNWILCLEADEILENKVNSEYLKRFLSPVNPEIFAFKLNHYHFYSSDTLWRVDAPWGKMQDVRLSRLFPNKRITKQGIVAGQCGYVPSLPEEGVRDTSIRIKNYGYVNPVLREQKKEFYEKIGIKNNNVAMDFSYLINENGMHRFPWVEDNEVTFYTPIAKGGDMLWRWLDTSAYFADQVVIGNDSNQLPKEDVDLINSYSNTKIVPTIMGDNFGEGRNKILEKIETEWVFQLDIDEYLNELCALKRIMDVPEYDAWMFGINNIQKDGGSIATETMRLFRNKDGVNYWGRLHETIDAHVKKNNWRISKAPIKMMHYGYTSQSDDEAYKKMQRYLKINVQQIKDNPRHGMAYYNLALHFLEDELVEDAIKLLELCVFFQPNFPLAGVELGKSYIRKANTWMNNSLAIMPDEHPIKQGFREIQKVLNDIAPKQYTIAPGHCMNYFSIHADDAKWLREHIIDLEKKIDLEKTKMLEERARK